MFRHMLLEDLERATACLFALSGHPTRFLVICVSVALLPTDGFTVGVYGVKVLLS
jgi:hypothetical protein